MRIVSASAFRVCHDLSEKYLANGLRYRDNFFLDDFKPYRIVIVNSLEKQTTRP